jgi:ribosomal protein S18 acetylase RimI-like enzyme
VIGFCILHYQMVTSHSNIKNMANSIEVIVGDLQNAEHRQAMLTQLDLYMQDPMGGHGKMDEKLASEIIEGLLLQPNYLFFLATCNGEYAGLANCFVNFSTFKAKPLINIHDFSVSPAYRKKGIGEAMMARIIGYARGKGYAKVNLEVRHDNIGAQNLYKKVGFVECEPPMYFWEQRV